MNRLEAITRMNDYGKNRTPFFFIISFNLESCVVISPEETAARRILFNFNNLHYNYSLDSDKPDLLRLNKQPVSFTEYSKAFDIVQKHLNRGNSYLVNLTFPTPVQINESLKSIFHGVKAKYRILYEDQFVAFSPETFVQIKDGSIYTFPMKGTIDAAKPDAKELLLENKKEQAEHATIVDLLRNDLSRVATNVKVEKFRYVDEIKSTEKSLLQVSSKISGKLPDNHCENLGSIIFELLPAGSISGAPKTKTLEIIHEAETYNRGFYTGIAGFFDGENLDSCVLIRYIENMNGQYFYKSGGGITTQSVLEEEYQELIDKIYVPFG